MDIINFHKKKRELQRRIAFFNKLFLEDLVTYCSTGTFFYSDTIDTIFREEQAKNLSTYALYCANKPNLD